MLQLSFVNFKQNSYILVEGTPATDRFFIIQSGKVKCYHETQMPGSSIRIYGTGDFIGVIPCMSGHSQTETVVALTDVTAIMVRRDQYPELIARNTPVAMKIVRSFALQMRSVNDALTRITAKKTSVESPDQIYETAKFYDDNGYSDIACFAYLQYIKNGAGGNYIAQAQREFAMLKGRSNAVYLEETKDVMRNYPKNTMIFSESQPGGDMFIIQDGTVRISRVVENKEITLALLRKGDMFGEMALLENKPRSANAIAHESCKLMTVNHSNFDQMVATQPQMIAKLTTMFAERLWSMYRQLANTQLREPREKMIDMLALQIEKQKVSVVKGMAYQTDLTPMDIVNLCAIPQQDQKMAIYQLSTDQNVKLSGTKIVIPDVPELIKQAAFYRKQNNRRINEL